MKIFSTVNTGTADRMIRLFVGIGIVGLAWFGPLAGAWTLVAWLVGAVLILTAALGYCPLYALLGIDTHRHEHRSSSVG
jgi:hypothetical protein